MVNKLLILWSSPSVHLTKYIMMHLREWESKHYDREKCANLKLLFIQIDFGTKLMIQ